MPSIVPASVYEHTAYLRASAAHVGAALALVSTGDATLALLRGTDGSRRTVYGLPRPYGLGDEATLCELTDAVSADRASLTLVLSPLGLGQRFAEHLADQLPARGARLAGSRPIALARVDEDPIARFDRRARRAIRTAGARGADVQVAPLEPWFGPFYRSAMAQLDAEPIYFFGDGYFDALAAVPHYVVSVHDAHGVAAAALFLHDGVEAYYHLGGRRSHVEPVLGAMSLALAEGLREAWRRACTTAVLGGGRSDDPGDSLLAFKCQLAPGTLPRLTVTVPGAPVRAAVAA